MFRIFFFQNFEYVFLESGLRQIMDIVNDIKVISREPNMLSTSFMAYFKGIILLIPFMN